MIIPERPAVTLTGYDPSAGGCTACGSQDTTHMDGFHGRRCDNCRPAFDVDKCVELAAAGFPGAALAYLRGYAS